MVLRYRTSCENGSDLIFAFFCLCLKDFQAFLHQLFIMHWDIEKKSLGRLMANQIYFLILNKCTQIELEEPKWLSGGSHTSVFDGGLLGSHFGSPGDPNTCIGTI